MWYKRKTLHMQCVHNMRSCVWPFAIDFGIECIAAHTKAHKRAWVRDIDKKTETDVSLFLVSPSLRNEWKQNICIEIGSAKPRQIANAHQFAYAQIEYQKKHFGRRWYIGFVHGRQGSKKNVTVAALKGADGAKRGHLNSVRSSISSRQETVDSSMQRCGLCSMLSRLVRRAMCVGSRRGSGESYYQELADTTVSTPCTSFTTKYYAL